MNATLLQHARSAPIARPQLPKPLLLVDLLSWSFVIPPPPTFRCASTPTVSRSPLLCSLGTTLATCSTLMVSHHLGVLLHTLAPSLLHLGTDQGFATFLNPLPYVSFEQARYRRSPERSSPQRGFIPLDEFPSLVAVPHHCGRCPLAVTTRPSHHRSPLCHRSDRHPAPHETPC
jgi:hypothetical protein